MLCSLEYGGNRVGDPAPIGLDVGKAPGAQFGRLVIDPAAAIDRLAPRRQRSGTLQRMTLPGPGSTLYVQELTCPHQVAVSGRPSLT